MFRVKRISETPHESDGTRVFIERTWPRGIKKEEATVHMILKEVAPSAELRRWFGGSPEKWDEFKRRYRDELRDKHEHIHTLMEKSRQGVVTLLHNSKEDYFNEATALRETLEEHRCRESHHEHQSFAGSVL